MKEVQLTIGEPALERKPSQQQASQEVRGSPEFHRRARSWEEAQEVLGEPDSQRKPSGA